MNKKSIENSYDLMANDFINFGMAAGYVTFDDHRGIHIQHINPMSMSCEIMPAIYGTKHDIIIADDISLAKMKEPDILQIEFPKLEEIKENHPHGWYRKFEKKRF